MKISHKERIGDVYRNMGNKIASGIRNAESAEEAQKIGHEAWKAHNVARLAASHGGLPKARAFAAEHKLFGAAKNTSGLFRTPKLRKPI